MGRQPQSVRDYGTLSWSVRAGFEHHEPPEVEALIRDRQDELVINSKNHLLDVRAAQRTFDLAYMRTSLGGLSFSLLVLRLFQPNFQVAAILYALLSVAIGASGLFRGKMVMQSYRKASKIVIAPEPSLHSVTSRDSAHSVRESEGSLGERSSLLTSPMRRETMSRFRRQVVAPTTFVTAASVVSFLSLAGILLEVGILVALNIDL